MDILDVLVERLEQPKMKLARECKPGEIVKVELGDFDNWVEVRVKSVEIQDDKKIIFKCVLGGQTLKLMPYWNEEVRIVE